MKRFGYYNNDFNNLFECYAKVTPIVERELPSVNMQRVTTLNKNGHSYPEAKFCKIFVQRPGGGADLTYFGKISSIDSDDGQGNTVITAKDGDKILNVVTTKSNAQVRVISNTGHVDDEFITSLPARFDSSSKDITIIKIEDL